MQIISATYVISSPDVAQCPPPDRPEYAFIGRSNVGKSSLINSICKQQKLAKTSSSPGKTQLINHFAIESTNGPKTPRMKWNLVDLPGYGYAVISQSTRRRWEQMIENYLRKRPNLINVFVLIDSRHSPQKIDLAFLTCCPCQSKRSMASVTWSRLSRLVSRSKRTRPFLIFPAIRLIAAFSLSASVKSS
jgi:GTP-binding protein